MTQQCTLLAIDNCPLTSVSGPLEILSLANSFVPRQKRFNIQVVSETTPSINCLGGVQLNTHGTLEDALQTDLLIIGAIGKPRQNPHPFKSETIEWIRQHYRRGTHITSICTGAFLLAATGLLNGKQATTHWAVEQQFRALFPEVKLQSKQIITHDGKLCCSGGASAYQDMSLYLIRQYLGDEVAQKCAKAVLIDLDRHTQQQYASFIPSRQHQDSVIHTIQDWLKIHATENVSVPDLAQKANLSERQLKRRFKQATNETPLAYIQALRVEHAKYLLETKNMQVDEISRESGYEDIRFFRQLFKRYTSLSPTEYRRKFAMNVTV